MARVQKTINWNEGQWKDARDAVCAMKGYSDTIVDPENPEATIPNPQSKVGFFNSWLKKIAFNQIKEYNNRLAIASVSEVTDEDEL